MELGYGYTGDVFARLERAGQILEGFVMEHVGRRLPKDMSFMQMLVMFRISKNQPVRSTKIRETCYFGSNIDYNLRALLEAGYVGRKAQGDARSYEYSLTEKGERAVAVLAPAISQLESEISVHFSGDAFREIVRWTQLMGRVFPAQTPAGGDTGHEVSDSSRMQPNNT